MFHLMSIISVSGLSQVLCFSTYSIFALLIAKIGMSVLIQTSGENQFLGDGSFTFSPSRRNSKSYQHINSLLHLKSYKTITSTWSTPTQEYLSFAGLVNSLKMISSGFKRNVFAQFSGPIIITLQNLPPSHACTSLKVSATSSLCYSAAALARSSHNHRQKPQTSTPSESPFQVFFHSQWKPFICAFSRCSQ